MSDNLSTTPSNSPVVSNLGYMFAVTSSFGTALAIVLGKWNLEAISPLLMNCLIFSVATVFLTVTYLPVRGICRIFTLSRQGWFWLAMFTITSWLAIWAFWAGVQAMDPSLAAFLNRTEVLVVLMLGFVFLRERFTRLEILGVVLSIAGIVIMRLTLRMEYSYGFWMVLLSALLFGLTEFLSKIALRHVGPTNLTFIRNMFMAAAYWIVLRATGEGFDGLDRVWPGVLALGLVGPLLGRLMYLQALKRMALSRVAIISQSQPVFVILIALLALHQLPTFREMVGGIFLTVGCVTMLVARNFTGRGRGNAP